MKYKDSKKIENRALIFLQEIINELGWIFRQIHLETDVGLDCYIEIVIDNNPTGKLLGIQVKSGKSYFNESKQEFQLYVDKNHLDYWKDNPLPILIFFYYKEKNIYSLVSVKEWKESKNLWRNKSISPIIGRVFNSKENLQRVLKDVKRIITRTAEVWFYKSELFSALEHCYLNTKFRLDSLMLLSSHPDSQFSPLLEIIIYDMLKDKDIQVVKVALFCLANLVDKFHRWYNPKRDKTIYLGYKIIKKLTNTHWRSIFSAIENHNFYIAGVGYQVMVLLNQLFYMDGISILQNLVNNEENSLEIRINALALLFFNFDSLIYGDLVQLIKKNEILLIKEGYGDLIDSFLISIGLKIPNRKIDEFL